MTSNLSGGGVGLCDGKGGRDRREMGGAGRGRRDPSRHRNCRMGHGSAGGDLVGRGGGGGCCLP